jgi:hypothetical protein
MIGIDNQQGFFGRRFRHRAAPTLKQDGPRWYQKNSALIAAAIVPRRKHLPDWKPPHRKPGTSSPASPAASRHHGIIDPSAAFIQNDRLRLIGCKSGEQAGGGCGHHGARSPATSAKCRVAVGGETTAGEGGGVDGGQRVEEKWKKRDGPRMRGSA